MNQREHIDQLTEAAIEAEASWGAVVRFLRAADKRGYDLVKLPEKSSEKMIGTMSDAEVRYDEGWDEALDAVEVVRIEGGAMSERKDETAFFEFSKGETLSHAEQEAFRAGWQARADLAAERELAVRIYNYGYRAGHHDTVESAYTDIYDADMGSYHSDEVGELLSALANHEQENQDDER